MINLIANILTPHYCCSCGANNTVLCDSCKYDIISESYATCFICNRPTAHSMACKTCSTPYTHSFSVGERTGAIEKLVDISKYASCRQGCQQQAVLLNERLPDLPPEMIVTAVPTIAKHIRQRGYDHMALVGRHLARLRGIAYRPTLERQGGFVQQGASRKDRELQASQSFRALSRLNSCRKYLLIDDVVTTGATLRHATAELLSSGAEEVWVATTAYQPK